MKTMLKTDGHFCLVMKTVVKCNVMEIAMKMLSKGDVNHAENFDGHLCLVMKTVMKSNWCYKHRYENVVQGDENHDVNHYYCLSLCFSDVTNLPADLLQKLQLLSMKLSPKRRKRNTNIMRVIVRNNSPKQQQMNVALVKMLHEQTSKFSIFLITNSWLQFWM